MSQGRLAALQANAEILAALDRGESAAVVLVVDGPDPEAAGQRLVVTADAVAGSLGDASLDETAAELAREALDTRERGTRDVQVEGRRWRLYVESHHPVPELLIVGAGHIARPLCRIGAMIGYRVTVMDDRAEFADPGWFPDASRVLVVDFADPFREVEFRPDTHVVLVTRAHRYDYDCILELLRKDVRPAYLGMIGSRRRVRAAFEALTADGVEPERLKDVRAPIGLDIAAETPEEIAVSIAAEMIALRRGGSGSALTEEENVLRRVERVLERRKKEAG